MALDLTLDKVILLLFTWRYSFTVVLQSASFALTQGLLLSIRGELLRMRLSVLLW